MVQFDPNRPVHAIIRHLYADRDDPARRSRYIHLGIYPDAESLREAGNRYSLRNGRNSDPLTDAEGVFQPVPFRSRYDRSTKRWVDTTGSFAGVMRLCRPRLSIDVLSHEATHAALHITRLHDWAQTTGTGTTDFGDNCSDREEAFAYLLGDLTAVLHGMVNKYKRNTRTSNVIPLDSAA